MSNRYEVSIAVRNREVLAKIAKEVAESEALMSGVQEVFDDANVSDVRDPSGKPFVLMKWHSYNHWSANGGDTLLEIVREVTKGDGFAYASIDDYGEDNESQGSDFECLLFVEKRIGTSLVEAAA